MPDRAHEKSNKKRAEYSLEEVALYNLSLFADHVWCEEEVDFHRAACQRTWVCYNRMKEACTRTSVLDLLAQVRLEQKKTVRDTIPFSHLAKYGNYEYDEGAEKNYVPEATVATLQPLPSDLSVDRPLSRRPQLFTNFDLTNLQLEMDNFTYSGQEQDRALLMASYADQLEYTAGYHDDPSLGRAEDPPLGNFGRVCGPFDPIKFSGLAKEILKEEKKTQDSWEPQAAAMNNVWRDNCISWANWLLCIYPEFLQNLCNRDEISKNMPPPDQTLDMAVDYLEILNRPISLLDVQQFLQPRLQSLSRYRQGLKRLYEQIASQEVRNLWMTDSEQAMNVTLSSTSASDSAAATPPVKLESEVYIGLSASDESAVSARDVSLSQLTMVSVPHRHRPMTKPKEMGHKSKSSRRRGSDGKRSESKRHGGSTPTITSRKELLSSKPTNKITMIKVPPTLADGSQDRISVPTTPRTPSAPILKELRSEDFPTLSEAAVMNFRQPMSSGGHSATPTRQTSPQPKSRSVAAVILGRPDHPSQADNYSPSDWTNFVDTPMQRSIHSKSDTDLHRSTSQGSNPQSSPISESSGGLRSESDSDIQLQESFQRCEDDACFLLRSTASGQSSSSEDSCLTSALLSSDDAHMNIHAPSFRPRGKTPQKQQLTRHLLSLFHAPPSSQQTSTETTSTVKTQSTVQPSVSPLSGSSGSQRVLPKPQHPHSQQPRPETKQRSSTTTTVYPGPSRQYAWQPLNQHLQPVSLQPPVTGSASAGGFYGGRRIPYSFQQSPQPWRPTFPSAPPLAQGSMIQPSLSQMLSGQPSVQSCKPPPGFETIYSIGDGSNSHPLSAHATRQPQPPPQLAIQPSMGPVVPQPPHRFFPVTTSVAQQHVHGYTTTNASTTVGYFPQAYSNQQDMFPYHSSSGMPTVVQSQAAQQQQTTSTETTSARTLVAAAAAMLSPRQSPGVTAANMDHIRSTFGSGLLPMHDGAAYLMNVHQQLLYPLAFPNQFVPSCRYLVPPPVRMPAPQQFLPPQLLPPQPQANCYTPSVTGSDLPFAWTRFDPSQSSVLPGYTTGSLFPNQFSQVSGSGVATTTTNGSTGVQFLQTDGISNSQQQNRALGLYLAGLSGYNDGSGGVTSARDDSSGPSCGRGTFWRHPHYPQSQPASNLQLQQQFLMQRAAALTQPEATSSNVASAPGSLTDDGGRKGRSRKREPSNLVQLVGLADLVALGGKRRERSKRIRSHQSQTQQPRLARGSVDAVAGTSFTSSPDGGLLQSHETPSEDSEEQSVTQNEESSEDWAADAQTTDVDDVGEVTVNMIQNLERATKHFTEENTETALENILTTAYDSENSVLSDLRTKKRRRSLNTSGSSRSSEADNAFDERGAPKLPHPSTSTGASQRQSRPRYRSYKECLQTTVKVPSSQSTADSPYDEINYLALDTFKSSADKGRSTVGSSVGLDAIELGSTTDLSLALLQAEAASSSSPPDTRSPSPDVIAAPDTPEEDSFESGGGGGGGSSNVSAGCNSPLVLTPRQCTSTEPNLLSHLAKWSAAKIADKAEGIADVNEGTENPNYGFRWIPEDDLERQAAEEYCPSKESSHEKLADRALPLHRSATGRGTSPASTATHTSPATASHGPRPPDAATATTATQVRGASGTERSTSGLDDHKERPTGQKTKVDEQDQSSSRTRPGQTNTTLATSKELHCKNSRRRSKQTDAERKSESSCPAKGSSGKVTSACSTMAVVAKDALIAMRSNCEESVKAKVPTSQCRASLDDMQIFIPPSNKAMHTKLRLPKMTTVVDLEASLQAMATAASSCGRGEAETGEHSSSLAEFFKNPSSSNQTAKADCQKSDLSKVVLKQQSEMLSVLLGVSKRVPMPSTRGSKCSPTSGDTQEWTGDKAPTMELTTKLMTNSNSTTTISDRFFSCHSQIDQVACQQTEGQVRIRSFKQVNKIDRRLRRLEVIAEGMIPTRHTPRQPTRRVLIGKEKGVKRRDETPGPGWEIVGSMPATGPQLITAPESSMSGIGLARLPNMSAEKHIAKDDKWVIGQEKNIVRQESHQVKRRQPRSRKGRHAPVVRLKSSSGNRKSRNELCMSSMAQPSTSLPSNLENDNTGMMGLVTSSTGIVKRLVFKTF